MERARQSRTHTDIYQRVSKTISSVIFEDDVEDSSRIVLITHSHQHFIFVMFVQLCVEQLG